MPATDQHSGCKNKSYKDALQWQIPQSGPGNSATAQNESMRRLKASLCSLMRRHPDGLSLAQVRRSCPLLCDPGLLDGFASTKQLLASLTDVVRLDGIGTETSTAVSVVILSNARLKMAT
ncbi:hypothetical protein SKAU_G00068890 [Synaphobranchus kaupii]|uniref:Uncharacterized protein n=1 Tax=Synaphobranchus kaupii TaxID=118154 RepID=A0A9Q1G6D0_SYNKA|nr:hypothetical protein SKAU_G00068890 [Synaphobranchus kaupii]